jgi:hypothetical protein
MSSGRLLRAKKKPTYSVHMDEHTVMKRLCADPKDLMYRWSRLLLILATTRRARRRRREGGPRWQVSRDAVVT